MGRAAAADCREVIVETASTRGGRPRLRATLDMLKPGDTLVIYKPPDRGLVAPDSGKPRFLTGHVLAGEDGSQLVGDAIRIPVKGRLEITPVGPGRVPGQLAFQFGASFTGGLPAGGLRAGNDYACGKCHGSS